MNQEILVMTARIKQWDTEINGLQLEINEYKSKLETARAERFDKLIQDKLNNYKAEWNDNLSWLKNEYNRDMESGATQFLLKYSDEKDPDNSSQRRSDQKNWNRQGNNNNNRSGGNFSNRNNSNNWNNNWNNNRNNNRSNNRFNSNNDNSNNSHSSNNNNNNNNNGNQGLLDM